MNGFAEQAAVVSFLQSAVHEQDYFIVYILAIYCACMHACMYVYIVACACIPTLHSYLCSNVYWHVYVCI